MPRILHVFYGSDFAGGASISMVTLVEGLAAKGYDIHALLPRTRKRTMARRLQAAGVVCHEWVVPWHVFDATSKTPATVVKNLLKAAFSLLAGPLAELIALCIIRRNHIDLVHIGGAVISTGSRAARVGRVPVVWHVREFVEEGHGLAYFPWFRFYDEVGCASAVVCVSEGLSEKLRTQTKASRVTTVPNGLVIAASTRDLAPLESPLRLMFAGGINRSKGTFLLLEALASAEQLREATLDVFGRANAEQREEFEQELERLGLRSTVTYRGLQPSLQDAMQEHDALVMASTREAFGRVTGEAMLAGCLVIGSDSGGTRELLAEGRGVLFSPGSVGALRDAIARVSADPGAFVGMRQRARDFALTELSADRYVARVADVYTICLGGDR